MKRQPTFIEAIFPIIMMLLLASIGFAIYGIGIESLLIIASLFAALIAYRVGLTWEDMLKGIQEKISSAMPALLILIAIGILIGMWTASGTIPAMIYYGLKLINPSYFMVIAFIVSAIVSIVTGSSWGSAGTVGVALMGIASGLDVPLAIAAGSVVSGAYFGDKLSPLSDTTNLAPLIAGTNIYDHIKHMLYTTIPASVLALIVYFFAGLNTSSGGTQTINKQTQDLVTNLNEMFTWSWWLVLPPLIILYGSLRKKPVLPTIIITSLVAGVVAVLVQGISVINAFAASVGGFDIGMIRKVGFNPEHITSDVQDLVTQGGMESMTGVVLIALCALAFAGILSASGALEVIVQALLKMVKRTGDLILVTVISTITTSLVTANTYLPIIIPGELYKDTYRKKKLAAKNLSRTLEDSGTVIIPLVPWSTSGIFMAETLGVPTLSYLPWAILCYTGFLFAIILGYTGIGIAPLEDEEEVEVEQ